MVRNLKPAPFAMTPSIVRRVIEPATTPSKGVVRIPILPITLADEVKGDISSSSDVPATIRPDCAAAPIASKSFRKPSARTEGPEEPARVAPVSAAPSAPAEFPNLGRPDYGEARAFAAKSIPAIGDVGSKFRFKVKPAPSRGEKIALPAPRKQMDSIREPARKKTLPPLASDVRRAQLNAATAFLKRLGILVTPCDREEQIRKYRVTGKAEAQFLEQVIEIAISYGFEADRV
ncbi:hypothetical protein [Novosphingobium clariflavum]|uniref:Uncharacterized protein n=1 Tax=Novosphingobium clariflavum TaxID=2029884 RepID=A0ABV6SBP2_9SPHN|nr:hypothetical protein [Novosphingobium clariflavum]